MIEKPCGEGCGRPAAPSRPTCYTCKSKLWREKNPIAYVYNNLKKSAKKRKYDFTITLKYFTKLVIKEKLMENRGRSAESFTVDRIKNHLGYIPGNLQIMTKSDNTKKWHEEQRKAHDLENVLKPGETVEYPF